MQTRGGATPVLCVGLSRQPGHWWRHLATPVRVGTIQLRGSRSQTVATWMRRFHHHNTTSYGHFTQQEVSSTKPSPLQRCIIFNVETEHLHFKHGVGTLEVAASAKGHSPQVFKRPTVVPPGDPGWRIYTGPRTARRDHALPLPSVVLHVGVCHLELLLWILYRPSSSILVSSLCKYLRYDWGPKI